MDERLDKSVRRLQVLEDDHEGQVEPAKHKKHPKKAKKSETKVNIEATVLESVTEGDDQTMVGERDVDDIRLDWVRAQVRKVDVRAASRRSDERSRDGMGDGRDSNCEMLVS